MDLHEYFLSLKDNAEFQYQKEHKKWFNGQFFSPLSIYKVFFKYNGAQFFMNFEVKHTLFNQPTISLGSMGDRNTFFFNCKTDSNVKESFEIFERSLWNKITKRNPERFFVSKTSDPALKAYLDSNEYLNSIYKISENSSEFCPSITGCTNKNFPIKYEINVNYSTRVINISALNLCIKFCMEFIDKFKN